MRRLLPLLLLPVLVLAACGASPAKPHVQASASVEAPEPSDPADDATDSGMDTGPDCAPVDGSSPAGQLTSADAFPGATGQTASYAHHTFAAGQCQTAPGLPVDLDAGCAQPFPFVSAGQQAYAHALLGTTGVKEMTEADLSAGTRALREIVVSYADARTAAAGFPVALAKACGVAAGTARRLTGADADGTAITSMVAVTGAKVVVVEFDGSGWADTDYARVLNLALTAAG